MKKGLIILGIILFGIVAFLAGRQTAFNSTSNQRGMTPSSQITVTQVVVRKINSSSSTPPALSVPGANSKIQTTTVNAETTIVATSKPNTKAEGSSLPSTQVTTEKSAVQASSISSTAAGLPPAGLIATQYKSKPGPDTKVRIEGTSNIHDWWVEGKLISGILNMNASQLGKLGPIKVESKVIIPIKSLHSSSGAKMDEVMYEHMETDSGGDNLKIQYLLEELTVRKPATANTAAECDSKGSLIIHGVTNQTTMPVGIQWAEDGTLKVFGTNNLKMTDFKIKPPCPALLGGLIKTGDDVKIIIQWHLTPVK